MNRTHLYTVAGHTFRLSMAGSDPLWQGMHAAYAPFEEPAARQPLFTLTIDAEVNVADALPVVIDRQPVTEKLKLNIYRTDDGYLFEIRLPFTNQLNGRLRISNDFRTAQAALWGSDVERLFGQDRVLMICYLLSTACLDTVLMHASAMVKDGKAYLFLGRSGTGKSTHSRLWLQHLPLAKPLNDDHPIVRIDPSGQAVAYGSPWSGKTPCYSNESAPVGGIVRIKQAPANRISRLLPAQAYASLLTSCSGMSWEQVLADGRNHTLQQLIATVPCWTLACLPDEAAARLCAATVGKEESCHG